MSEQTSPFSFQESPVWHQAMTLAEHVFAKTERFPLREHAGLASYMRDSAQKLAACIAADNMRDAQALAKKLFTQATLAARLGHLEMEDAISMLVDIEAISAALTETTIEVKTSTAAPVEAKPKEHAPAKPRSNNKRPDKRSRDSNRGGYGDKRVKRNAS